MGDAPRPSGSVKATDPTLAADAAQEKAPTAPDAEARATLLYGGQVVERYTVMALLGRGAMAEVYRVRHNQLGSTHALKVLTVASVGTVRRLIRESMRRAAPRAPVVDVDKRAPCSRIPSPSCFRSARTISGIGTIGRNRPKAIWAWDT